MNHTPKTSEVEPRQQIKASTVWQPSSMFSLLYENYSSCLPKKKKFRGGEHLKTYHLRIYKSCLTNAPATTQQRFLINRVSLYLLLTTATARFHQTVTNHLPTLCVCACVCSYLAMPRLENPAGTMRTSRRGKG